VAPQLEVDLPIFYLRHVPVQALGDQARAMEASGVVDSVTLWDQLTFHIPPALWTPEDTPLAETLPDIDSVPDPYLSLGYVAASAPGLGLTTTTDSIRRGPGELMQAMLTMADLCGGRAKIQMGAGDVKQTKPFGWKRSQGLSRMEDHFRTFHEFLDNEDPISFEGNHWKLDGAWLGYAKQNRPKLLALGGGPKLIDIATSYADGFSTLGPQVWRDAEAAAEQIGEMKEDLAKKGRDPDEFIFGLWAASMIHEDDAVIEQALDSEVVRWLTATLGRTNPNDWDDKEGIPSPMPRDWHYSKDSIPVHWSREEAQVYTSKVTPEMSRLAWFCGDVETVADRIQPYIDAGVSFVHLVDLLPLTQPVEEGPRALQRGIELARAIKSRNGSA
jgi:phthiodiolone/phenolphthiodiolone dimycocerosates ketoreductase